MKSLPIFALALAFISKVSARDFRPTTHIENIPASDSSVRQCHVIQTLPGLCYKVEVSGNLMDWTVQDEFYGLGHEHVVTMREYSPAPSPPQGTPPTTTPALASNASLRLQRSADVAGGSVVSWASLDHGGPVLYSIAGEMDLGWNQLPLFWERHGDWNFFIWHPNTPLVPPAANPPLGPQDSAMIDTLETCLPAMNQQIIDSIARARNAPPPPPTDPDSKRFWRVRVDWSVDTDGDGSPDWAEFEIAARGTGMMVSGVIGDPFNADTNGDGIPDGNHLDVDLDGTADALDPDSTDATATIPLGPIPRYALFEIPGKAIQINDRGTVIFPEMVWRNGLLSPLPGGRQGTPPASARGINDLDVILGTANQAPDGTDYPMQLTGEICYWPAPDQPYQYIQVVEDGTPVEAYVYANGFQSQGPAPILSASGQFIAHGHVPEPPPDYVPLFDSSPTLWQIPMSGTPASRQIAPQWSAYLNGPDLIWGSAFPADDANPGAVHGAGGLPHLPFVPFNVVKQILPTGGVAIFATSGQTDMFNPAAGAYATVVYDGQRWRPNDLYANAVDIAEDGTAIGRSLPDGTAPILLNGKWTGIDRAAPVPTDVFEPPPPWHDSSVTLEDTTPGGWILARRGGFPLYDSAALLPIRAEGYYQRTDGISITEAAGVDDFSIGSEAPGSGIKDRIWIMAPQGGFNKVVKIKAPLNAQTKLNLSATNILFGTQDSITISDPVSPVTLRASDAVSSGGERLMTLTMGSGGDEVSSISKPIGLKIMKGRTVNVTVYRVTKLYGSTAEREVDVLVMPTEEEIANHLKDIFRPQINVVFNVNLEMEPLRARWDDNADASFDVQLFGGSPGEEDAILSEIPPDPDPYDIRVFLVANIAPLGSGVGAYGLTDRERRTCWVLGSKFGKNKDKPFLLDTIAHEIGHVFVGEGHPDQDAFPGPAPLPGTKHNCRLMCSGPNSDGSSRLLVKAEWDEAEEWLKAREQQGGLGP